MIRNTLTFFATHLLLVLPILGQERRLVPPAVTDTLAARATGVRTEMQLHALAELLALDTATAIVDIGRWRFRDDGYATRLYLDFGNPRKHANSQTVGHTTTDSPSYASNPASHIRIIIDTISTLSYPSIYLADWDAPRPDRSRPEWTAPKGMTPPPHPGLSALVYYIVNDSDSLVRITRSDWSVPSILEALDGDQWRPIEYWIYSDCGNSYESIVLHPGQYVAAAMYRYDGPLHTKLRVKVDLGHETMFYSEPFDGAISPGQLDPIEQPRWVWNPYLDVRKK